MARYEYEYEEFWVPKRLIPADETKHGARYIVEISDELAERFRTVQAEWEAMQNELPEQLV